MPSFLNNHLPILMAARRDAMDVIFSETSFPSRCLGVGGWAMGVFWPWRATAVNTNWMFLPV